LGGDFHLGHGKRRFLKGEKITSNAIGLFKKIFKYIFPNEKHLSQHEMKNLQDQRPSLG